jgi:hypothetical protein
MPDNELAKAIKLFGWAKLTQTMLIAVVIAAVIGGGIYISRLKKDVSEANRKLAETNRVFLRLNRAVRAHSVEVESLSRYIRDWRVDPEVLELIRRNQEEISLVGKTVTELAGTSERKELAPKLVPESPDVRLYSSEITLPEGPPIAWWKMDTMGRAEQGLYPFDVNILKTLSEQDTGGVNVYNQLYLTSNRPGWENRRYHLPIKSAEVRFVNRERRSFTFAPALDIGIDLGWKPPEDFKIGYSIGATLFSYGGNRIPRWRFFRFGISGMGDDFSFGFSPVAYNFGELLPLVNDLWLHAGINHRGRFLLGVSTVF